MTYKNNHHEAYETVYWFAVGTIDGDLYWGDDSFSKTWRKNHNILSDWYRDNIRGIE